MWVWLSALDLRICIRRETCYWTFRAERRGEAKMQLPAESAYIFNFSLFLFDTFSFSLLIFFPFLFFLFFFLSILILTSSIRHRNYFSLYFPSFLALLFSSYSIILRVVRLLLHVSSRDIIIH